MILTLLHGGIHVDIHTQTLLHVVACAGRCLTLVETVGGSGVGTCIDSCVVHTLGCTVIYDIVGEAGITAGIRLRCIILAALIADGITVSHRECVNKILSGVHASVSVERWGEVCLFLLGVVLVDGLTPDYLLGVCSVRHVIDLSGVAVVCDTGGIHACCASDMVEHSGCRICRILPGSCRCIIGRAGSKEEET